MKYNIIKYFSLSLLLSFFLYSCNEVTEPADYVDPFMGTQYFGHTYPGVASPFGMIRLSPDTDTKGWNSAAGYRYENDSIIGFSHTHYSGVGMAALGDILLMPAMGQNIPQSGYRSSFSHKNEYAAPGYYSVVLDDHAIKVELTATKRAGIHRYSYPAGENAHIIIDLGHSIGDMPEGVNCIKIVSDNTVQGYKQSRAGKVYFYADFSQNIHTYGTFDASFTAPESGHGIFPWKNEEKGEKIGAFISFKGKQAKQIVVKLGISYTSIENARLNLEAETSHKDFDIIRKEAEDNWNRELSKVKISSTDTEAKEIFYTSLYRSLLAQEISQDTDGTYMGMDGKLHKADGFDLYPSFSCWDTYRSQHPLLTIIAPERVNDMIRSIEVKTREYGWLPAQHFGNVFGQGMAGDHLVPIIADAYMKGIKDYDAEYLYSMIRQKATGPPPAPLLAENGRSGIEDYLSLGYVPVDKRPESVSNTLETAYDDWCIAQIAGKMGLEDDKVLFLEHSQNYRNLYDSTSCFFRPRMADGSWLQCCEEAGGLADTAWSGEHSWYDCFDPLLIGRRPNRYYSESNAWQYLWSVQHDIAGLVELMGGKEAFESRLDEFFSMSTEVSNPKYVGVVGTIGQYVHGNQPSHHVAYLYNYAGKAWKTQEKVRQALDLYATGPGGLCGNEDMGSLSSWYVLSSLGFYPVAPGSNNYQIGSPLFEEAEIRLSGPYKGKVFRIKANNVSKENKYIQSAILNGKAYNSCSISHEEIVSGGELVLEMGAKPNKEYGN